MSHSKDKPVLNVDDDKLYVVHDEGKEEGQGEGPTGATMAERGANINRFRNRLIHESSDEEEEEEVSSDEVSGVSILFLWSHLCELCTDLLWVSRVHGSHFRISLHYYYSSIHFRNTHYT